jgi:hypothetical protein
MTADGPYLFFPFFPFVVFFGMTDIATPRGYFNHRTEDRSSELLKSNSLNSGRRPMPGRARRPVAIDSAIGPANRAVERGALDPC